MARSRFAFLRGVNYAASPAKPAAKLRIAKVREA
jgi:hypothetical protein